MNYIIVTVHSSYFNVTGRTKEIPYPKRFIRPVVLENIDKKTILNSKCIFAYKEGKLIKKLYIGIIENVTNQDADNIYCNILINDEIESDEKFNKYNGWSILPEKDFIFTIKNKHDTVNVNESQENFPQETKNIQELTIPNEINLLPTFFEEITKTTDFNRFEELTYLLLKLIGLNDLIKINPRDAAGKADGFFRIGNFAVIYDATLKENYLDFKKMQIKSYIERLKDEIFTDVDEEFEFPNFKKAVWIITKGENKVIRNASGIKIKEVSIKSLITVYSNRLKYNWSEEKLEENLLNI